MATKNKIAAALRKLMLERSFQKITVQNLMDVSGMKRQSFYYHFQDTRDVLGWICQQNLILPLQQSELGFEDWLLFALELLEQDRSFYRRALAAGDIDRTLVWFAQLLQPKLSVLMYAQEEFESLGQDQQFVVRFASRAIIAHGQQFAVGRKELDLTAARSHLHCLLETVGMNRTESGG